MKPLQDFNLSADPAPTRRTIAGRRQRQTLAYKIRNRSYDILERLAKNWRAHRNQLPAAVAAILGVGTVAEFLWWHRSEFREIMRRLNLRTVRQLLTRYARTGRESWQFDHREPLRFTNGDSEQRNHHSNVRPRIAAANKARRYEAPTDHTELDLDGRGEP